MKKEMKKKEIIERLTELQRFIETPREEVIQEINERYKTASFTPIHKENEYYPFMMGWVSSEIDFILKGGY